jgi:hypothetical protein
MKMLLCFKRYDIITAPYSYWNCGPTYIECYNQLIGKSINKYNKAHASVEVLITVQLLLAVTFKLLASLLTHLQPEQ